MTDYFVATTKPWNLNAFQVYSRELPGAWHLIDQPEQLSLEQVQKFQPRYIFFPHWSWLVPDSILQLTDCVCFHMTDLPFGRGGSPLQNLILRGVEETRISALRMTEDLDAGPVYMKRPLSLQGSAQEIFERFALTAADMIKAIIENEPSPNPQQGTPTYFQRRKPEQSRIPPGLGDSELYDYIRMLDAETYPRAFIEQDGHRVEFSQAKQSSEGLTAKAVFTQIRSEQ